MNKSKMRKYGAGKGIPRFFKSALFPLIAVVIVVYIVGLLIKGG